MGGGPGEAEALNSPPLFVFPSRRCSHRRRCLLSPPTHAHLAQFSSGQRFVFSSAQTSVLFSPTPCSVLPGAADILVFFFPCLSL